jgi:uncharacterized membrane protein YeiH
MIGRTPVGWMLNLEYVYVICALFSSIFRKSSRDCVRHYFCLTPLDLEFYIDWYRKGISVGLHPVVCVALGNDRLFGGVIRDILC